MLKIENYSYICTIIIKQAFMKIHVLIVRPRASQIKLSVNTTRRFLSTKAFRRTTECNNRPIDSFNLKQHTTLLKNRFKSGLILIKIELSHRSSGNTASCNVKIVIFQTGEKLYKMIGTLPEKDLSMLEERIKRCSLTRPPPGGGAPPPPAAAPAPQPVLPSQEPRYFAILFGPFLNDVIRFPEFPPSPVYVLHTISMSSIFLK